MKHLPSLLFIALIVPFGCTSNSSPSATKYEGPVERERTRVTEVKAAPTSQPMDPAIAKIRDEGLNRSQVMDTLSYLCDVIGARLTASPGERRATSWARERLEQWGLSNAHLHAWGPFGRGWEVKRFSMQVTSPTSFNVNAYPKAWSPGFDNPIEAPVTFIDARNERDLEQYKGKLKGHIVLLGQPREVEARFEPLATRVTDERLEELADAQPGTNAGPGAPLGQQQPRTETAAERRAQFAETPVGEAMTDRNRGGTGARGRGRGQAGDVDRNATTQPATQPTTRPGGGRGRGQAFSSRLLQFAQQEGAVLALTPSTRGDGGTFFVSQASIPGEGVRRGGTTQASATAPTTTVADATPPTTPATSAPIADASPTTSPATTSPTAAAARPRVWSVDPPKIIPQAMVAVEDYNRMIRMLKKDQQLTMAVDFTAQFYSDDLKSYNVIAEIPGTDLKDEIVMVGAHIDSWHSATGATDNAAGTACAMEAVRIIKALNLQPRRTIRVALWTGEEQGLMGSSAYVKEFLGSDPDAAARREAIRRAFQEAAESGDPTSQPTTPPPAPARNIKKEKDYEKLSVYFNLDNGTGKIRGIYAQGNESAVPIFKDWLAPFHDVGATTVTRSNTGSTDHVSFDGIGLPGFQFIQDQIEYSSRTHHSNQDNYDRLQAADMKQAATIMSAFIWNAANMDERFPRKPVNDPPTTAPATAPRRAPRVPIDNRRGSEKMIRLNMFSTLAMIAMLSSFCSNVALAEEQVDNPQYQGWSKFTAGTAVKYTQTVEAMGQKQEVQVTMTLLSISPEKATIETKATITVQGQTQEPPAQKIDIPAKVNKSEAQDVGQPAPNIKADVKQGEEKVEVGGKSYDCKWTEVTSEQAGTNVVAKTWLSDDVPGKLVKLEATTTGAMASTTKMTLASVEKK